MFIEYILTTFDAFSCHIKIDLIKFEPHHVKLIFEPHIMKLFEFLTFYILTTFDTVSNF